MPAYTLEQIAALRADGHWMRVYLSALIGAVVWSGTISSTPAAANALNLAVTGVSGAHTAVKRGMRVVIKTPGGGTKGTLTVRHAGTLSSGNLPVREFSQGHSEVEAGDTFEVWNDFQLVDRLVAANEAFDPDGEVYTDQNSLLAPVGTSGGPWAGWVDEGETFATILLTGAAYTIDEDSGGTVTYLTTLPSGCSFDSGSSNTDASPTIEADVGYHVIERTFTDASNSKSETQYVLISVHDESHPPYDLPDELTVAGERGRGFGLNGVRLFENAALADLPDRAPVIVWCDEQIGGVAQSIGLKAAGRSHILCVGYLRRDTGKIDGKGNELRFDISAPLQRLSELPGFSKVMMREASPDTWSEIEGLSVKRAIIQLLRHYTNALQLWDVTFDGFSDAAYSTFFLQKQVPFEQVRELADARDGSLSADASGRLELQQLLEFTPLGDRAGVTETITLGLDDILIDPADGLHVEIVRDHDRPVEKFRARGFTAGINVTQNTPLFGKWAASPGTGTNSSTVERMIADDATSFLARTALRGAWEDRIYTNADGEQFHAPEVKVTLPGSYRGIFQFYREYVRLDLDETTNPRGIDLREFVFIVTTVEVQVRQGTARVVLTLRAATYAEGGADDTPEAEVETPYLPPVLDFPSLTLPGSNANGLGALTGTLAVFDQTGGKVHITTDFQKLPAGFDPTWVNHALGLTGTLSAFVVRADSPKYADGAGAVNGYLATASQARTISDVFGARMLGGAYSYAGGAAVGPNQVQMQAERGNPDWVLVAVYNDASGVNAYRTATGGAAWSAESSLPSAHDSNLPNNAATWMPGLWLHPNGDGRALVSACIATANPPGANFWSTDDYGATWVVGSAAGDWPCACIVKPLNRNDVAFHGFIDYAAGNIFAKLYRIIGTTQTDISPIHSGSAYGVGGYSTGEGQRSFSVADDDPNAVVLVGYNAQNGKHGVFQSFNGLDSPPTWEVLITPDTSVPYRGAYYVNRTTIYLFGASGWLALLKYSGGAWRLYETQISGCGTIVGLCGG